MLHAECNECGKSVNLPVNPNGSVEILLEEPTVTVDENGDEIEIGGKAIEVTVIDPDTGEQVDEHYCRECLVFKIASVSGPNTATPETDDPEEPEDADEAEGDPEGETDEEETGSPDPATAPEDEETE